MTNNREAYMKKIVFAMMLAAGCAQAGQYDGAYHCSAQYQNKPFQFYQMVSAKDDGAALLVPACPGDPDLCFVGGYMLGSISGSTFTGINESGQSMAVQFSPLGFYYTETSTGMTPEISISVTCTKVW